MTESPPCICCGHPSSWHREMGQNDLGRMEYICEECLIEMNKQDIQAQLELKEYREER